MIHQWFRRTALVATLSLAACGGGLPTAHTDIFLYVDHSLSSEATRGDKALASEMCQELTGRVSGPFAIFVNAFADTLQPIGSGSATTPTEARSACIRAFDREFDLQIGKNRGTSTLHVLTHAKKDLHPAPAEPEGVIETAKAHLPKDQQYVVILVDEMEPIAGRTQSPEDIQAGIDQLLDNNEARLLFVTIANQSYLHLVNQVEHDRLTLCPLVNLETCLDEVFPSQAEGVL